MEAQILSITLNGVAEARNPNIRDRYTLTQVEKREDIKPLIWKMLCSLGRGGYVLVKWQDKMFLCEMKQDLKGYKRMEVNYHPHMDKFV